MFFGEACAGTLAEFWQVFVYSLSCHPRSPSRKTVFLSTANAISANVHSSPAGYKILILQTPILLFRKTDLPLSLFLYTGYYAVRTNTPVSLLHNIPSSSPMYCEAHHQTRLILYPKGPGTPRWPLKKQIPSWLLSSSPAFGGWQLEKIQKA